MYSFPRRLAARRSRLALGTRSAGSRLALVSDVALVARGAFVARSAGSRFALVSSVALVALDDLSVYILFVGCVSVGHGISQSREFHSPSASVLRKLQLPCLRHSNMRQSVAADIAKNKRILIQLTVCHFEQPQCIFVYPRVSSFAYRTRSLPWSRHKHSSTTSSSGCSVTAGEVRQFGAFAPDLPGNSRAVAQVLSKSQAPPVAAPESRKPQLVVA